MRDLDGSGGTSPVAAPRRSRLARRSGFWNRTTTLWFLVGLAPALFFQTALHEGSHCLTIEATSRECIRVAPFPYASATGYTAGATAEDIESDDQTAVFGAPVVLDVLLIVALLLALRRRRSEQIALLLRLWLFAAIVDALANTVVVLGGQSDWTRMGHAAGLTRTQLIAITIPVWLVAASASLVPMPAPTIMRRRFRGVATLYLVLSLAAVVVSVTVSVPGIVRSSPVFWIPLSVQCLIATGCAAFLVATRHQEESR